MVGGVVLCLCGAIAQSGSQFGQSQCHRGSAQRAPAVGVHLALGHADLQADHIVSLLDLTPALDGGNMTHTVVALSQIDQIVITEVGKDLLADVGAVQHLVGFLGAGEQEGQIHDLGFVVEGSKAGSTCKDQINGAHTGGLDRLGIVAQRAAVLHIALDCAAGSLFDQLTVLDDGLGGHTVFAAGAVQGQSGVGKTGIAAACGSCGGAGGAGGSACGRAAASGQTQSCCADTGDLQKAAARDLFHNSVLLFSWAEAFFVQLLLPNRLIDEKSDVVGL